MQRHLFYWARFVLRKQKPMIIGITGSVGKSTTTEVVSAVLMHPLAEAVVGRVASTSNNMNNHDGLPLVVLGFHEFVEGPLGKFGLMLRLPFRALRLAVSRRYPEGPRARVRLGPVRLHRADGRTGASRHRNHHGDRARPPRRDGQHGRRRPRKGRAAARPQGNSPRGAGRRPRLHRATRRRRTFTGRAPAGARHRVGQAHRPDASVDTSACRRASSIARAN